MMIDDDMNMILERLTFSPVFCSLQLINDVFLCFQSLSGVQFLIVGVVHEADDALAHVKQFGNDE